MNRDPQRRDIVVTMAKAFAAVGAAAAVYVLARGSAGPRPDATRIALDVDLDTIPVGTERIVNADGVPVVIRHRPIAEVERARMSDQAPWRDVQARNDNRDLKSPPLDANRSLDARPAWLILIGRCTKDDCLVRTIDGPDRLTDGIGWICPCCASRYDLSGRVLSGPAAQHLRVPRHTFDGKFLHFGPYRRPLPG